MALIFRYLCYCCNDTPNVKRAELESMYTLCSELELRLKDTEEQLTRSKSEAEDAIWRCDTFSEAYEAKLEERDKVIQTLRVSLKKSRIPDIKYGLTNMSREITARQKQEHEYMKNRCTSLEKTVESLRRENKELNDEIVKLKKSLSKAKKNKKRVAYSSRQREAQEIPLMTQWQTAVYRCDKVELRRLLPLVEFNTRQKALFWFVKFDNVDLVKLLLDNETNSPSYIGSILWYAVEKGSEKVCEELVIRKADVNVVNDYGVDLITFCANSTTNDHCRKRLLSILYKADTNRQNKWVNDEGEEIDLRIYCGVDEGVEDNGKNFLVNDGDSQSTDSTFK